MKWVQQEEQVYRADLARICNMSMPTVSRLTKQLIEEGCLLETEIGASCGGRRPVMLEMNGRYGYVIGIDFECTNVEYAVYDFKGNCVYSNRILIRRGAYMEYLYRALDDAVDTVRAHFKQKPLCISIAGHGIIDEEAGVITRSMSFGWRDIHLRQMVEERYGLPVILMLNMQMAAYGEWLSNYRKKGYNSITTFVISHGAGSGTILDGEILRGKGAAGEVGLSLLGLRNEQGYFKTLEQMAAGQRLSELARERWNDPKNVFLREYTNDNPEDLFDEDIITAIRNKDAFALQLLDEVIPYIGIGIASLIHLYDPGLIVITGIFRELGDQLLEPLLGWLKDNMMLDELNRTHIEISKLKHNPCISGAAYIAYDQLFAVPSLWKRENRFALPLQGSDEPQRRIEEMKIQKL